jgi:hypothetical protein
LQTRTLRLPNRRSESERLVTLKNRYDPTNFFRANQNIVPTTQQGW